MYVVVWGGKESYSRGEHLEMTLKSLDPFMDPMKTI